MRRSGIRVRRLAVASVFAALTFAATWIAVPSPFAGNLNFGDGMLLLSASFLPGVWGLAAAPLGAALCDLLGAYTVYAPATAVIKLLSVAVFHGVGRLFPRVRASARMILAGAAAELVNAGGYFLYEALFLRLGAAAVLNLPVNAAQGLLAVAVASVAERLLFRTGAADRLNRAIGNDRFPPSEKK